MASRVWLVSLGRRYRPMVSGGGQATTHANANLARTVRGAAIPTCCFCARCTSWLTRPCACRRRSRPAEVAVDILHDHRIRVDVGLVVLVVVSGRELVQHGWALRDDGG